MITKIVKAEIYKFMKSNGLKLSIGAIFLYGVITIIPFQQILRDVFNIPYVLNNDVVYGYQASYSLDFSSFFLFILPFLIYHFFTADFTQHTVRNLVGLRLKTRDIVIGKYAAFAIAIYVLFFTWGIYSTIIYSLINGWGENITLLHFANIILCCVKMASIQFGYATVPIILSFTIKNAIVVVVSLYASSLLGSIFLSFATLGGVIFRTLCYICPDYYMLTYTDVYCDSKTFLGASVSILIHILFTIIMSKYILSRKTII